MNIKLKSKPSAKKCKIHDPEFYHSNLRNKFVLYHLLEIHYLFALTENDTQYYLTGRLETETLTVKEIT